jgi:hypothetical protein
MELRGKSIERERITAEQEINQIEHQETPITKGRRATKKEIQSSASTN